MSTLFELRECTKIGLLLYMYVLPHLYACTQSQAQMIIRDKLIWRLFLVWQDIGKRDHLLKLLASYNHGLLEVWKYILGKIKNLDLVLF
jgi:hypothetical protein